MNRYIRRYREIKRRGIRGRFEVVRLGFVILIVVVVLTCYSVWSRSTVRRLNREKEALRQELLALSDEVDGLRRDLGELTSRSALVRRGVRELGMVFPGQEDIVYVIIDSTARTGTR